MTRILILLILLFSNSLLAEEIVAILDLKFIKDTRTTAAVFCYDEDGKNCGEWATFYLYKAKVKKVLSGELNEKQFSVIYGRHAFRQNNHKSAFVKLKKLESGAEAQYQILEFSQNFNLVCFKSSELEQLDSKLEIYNENLKCAEKEEL